MGEDPMLVFRRLGLLVALASLCLAGQATPLHAAAPASVSAEVAAEMGCLSCHQGIERFSEVALQECEQYIRGFTDAYLTTVAGGAGAVTCLPPEGNRDAEIRWAFMKWAHKNFEKRNDPAAAGLMATLKEVFECK
jgi:hypothetical protein